MIATLLNVLHGMRNGLWDRRYLHPDLTEPSALMAARDGAVEYSTVEYNTLQYSDVQYDRVAY